MEGLQAGLCDVKNNVWWCMNSRRASRLNGVQGRQKVERRTSPRRLRPVAAEAKVPRARLRLWLGRASRPKVVMRTDVSTSRPYAMQRGVKDEDVQASEVLEDDRVDCRRQRRHHRFRSSPPRFRCNSLKLHLLLVLIHLGITFNNPCLFLIGHVHGRVITRTRSSPRPPKVTTLTSQLDPPRSQCPKSTSCPGRSTPCWASSPASSRTIYKRPTHGRI